MTVETSVIGLLEDSLEKLWATETGRDIRAVQAAIACFRGESGESWGDIAPLAAARKLLRLHGALSTSEIDAESRARGVKSRAKNPVASLHATLRNAKDIIRVGSGKQGKWALRSSLKSSSQEAA